MGLLLLLLLVVLISFGGALGVFVSLFLLSLMADTTFGLDGRTDARGDGYFSCHVPFLVHSVSLEYSPFSSDSATARCRF